MQVTTTYALIWISVSFAVSVAIVSTGSLVPLWALLIPTLINLSYKNDN